MKLDSRVEVKDPLAKQNKDHSRIQWYHVQS